jgi:suppressor of ftsI
MKRRHFLLGALGATGLAGSTALRAQTMHHDAMGAMPGMTMQAMPGMAAHSQAPAPPPAGAAGLAAANAIPGGAALKELPRLQNESSERGVFRATLTAAPVWVELIPGKSTEVWAYNGMVPGPLIELNGGDRVEITLHNRLSQPTTVHWHGLPVPADQDGNPGQPVAPGASRTYRFTIAPDAEGLYWYHPHPHRLSAEQVYRGLAGAIRIKSPRDPLTALPQRVLMVTDLKLNQDASVAENDAGDWMNGREGQFVLVNGQRQPRLVFSDAGRERWRILNATNGRYLRLQLPRHGFTLVGTDGGLLATPQTDLREYLLAPAQRIDVLVDAHGTRTAPLLAAAYERGKMGNVARAVAVPLLQVEFGTSRRHLAALPATLRPQPDWGPVSAHKQVVMSETMSMSGGAPQTAFLLNGRSFDMQRVDLTSRVGAVEQWEIVNRSDMDHPFHIHGTQFTVIERELHGRITRAPYPALYDTVNLKSGETVRIKVVQALPGRRMYHCHILEHEDLGMMGQLEVS